MNLTFEDIIRYYYCNENSSNSVLSSNRNLDPIKKWLVDQLEINDSKNNGKSTLIRKQGNEFYKKKSLEKCLKTYNRSICCALESSEEYFLGLANRSAVTFELGKFEDCIKDIESCLKSCIYPKNLRPKLQLRKLECLKKLGRYSESQGILENFNTSQDGDKFSDEILEKLGVENLSISKENGELPSQNVDMYKLPSFENGENSNFAYASSKIEMRYNEQKGRHVVAKQNIHKGDVLFLEEAFAFGLIFDEDSRTTNMLKCYRCLKNIYSGIPCRRCIKCIFCDSKCREESWNELHRWECPGMLGDIWYHLGIAFPAFSALLKGTNSSFREIDRNYIKSFGNKEDNYPFFNSLIFEKDTKHLDVSVMSATVTTYLKEYTNFFDWFLSQPKNSHLSMDHIMNFFEIQLGKHILQFQNNSSIIEHWLEEDALPFDKEPIACGIFPSVSIMNHSCKPNITNYFVRDTIVVTSVQDIKENEEIYNCYGIYYRNMNRDQRQNACAQLYHFECKCVICSDPFKEMDAYDSFICLNCGSDIPKINFEKHTLCEKCGSKIDNQDLSNMYRDIELQENENDVELQHNSLVRGRKLLNSYHSELQNICFRLYQIHKEVGNYKQMLKYFDEWLKVEKIKIGQDVQLFGSLLYEIGSLLLLKFNRTSGIKDEHMIANGREYMAEAKRICTLHYPPYIIDKICWN